MEKFTKIISNAAYLPIINIDTDMIIPKQFLTTIIQDQVLVKIYSMK